MVSRAGAIRTAPPAAITVQAARRIVAALLVAASALVMYSLAWDSTWHGSVGRDQGFLSPPHALMYGSAAAGGLVCLGAVLMETARYHRPSGVHDGNSVRVLWFFHGPIGLLLGGFGLLVLVAAGPLDNYWHSLYGIFMDAWKPFHLMGELGGGIWVLGNLYLWASLLRQARSEGTRRPVEWWGFLAASTVLMRLMTTLTYPGLHANQTMGLAPLRFMTYPVVLTLATVWVLIAVRTALARRWAASASVALLLGFHLVIQLTVPLIVRAQAAAEGRAFLHPTLIPTFSPDRMAPDLGLLACALLLDILWNRRGEGPLSKRDAVLVAGAAAPGFWLVGVLITAAAQRILARVVLPAGVPMSPPATWQDGLIALPITLAAACLSALIGRALGDVLRRNPR